MEELDLSQLFQLLWNRKFEIILIILIFIVLGVTYTVCFVTPKYTSSTTILLATEQGTGSSSESSITTTELTLNSKLVSTYTDLIKSKTNVRKVINNLGIDISEDNLKNSISVKAKSDTEIIEISVTNENPKIAADIANEVASVFTEQVKEIYKINNVHVVDVAEEEANPSNIHHAKDVVIFAFIGVVISVIYVLLSNMLDTTVKTVEDIEKQCGVTVLASIPFDNSSEGRKGGKK